MEVGILLSVRLHFSNVSEGGKIINFAMGADFGIPDSKIFLQAMLL
jgi:hypothetical protein